MIEIDTIYQGHAINIMRQMPDKWLNCCITSPPYWGLRDYGIEPLIWDGDPECEHEWGGSLSKRNRWGLDKGIEGTMQANQKGNAYEIDQGNFCLKCNAWRGSLGLEPTIDMYISHLCSIFDMVKQKLRDDGTLWVNLGDTYAINTKGDDRTERQKENSKHTGKYFTATSMNHSRKVDCKIQEKSLCMIPFRFAIEMVNRGWILRNDIIWHKPNCMPSSAKDRFTVDFEHVFFFTKSKRYYFEQQFDKSITIYDKDRLEKRERNVGGRNDGFTTISNANPYPQGRNRRAVWSIATKGFSEAHFATFPEALIEPMIKAGCPEGGLVYDPFMGAGTVAVVAKRLDRHYIGSELNASYIDMANRRIGKEIPQMEFSLAGG